MNEKYDHILRKIRELPPLPVAAQKLLEVVDDSRSCANDLTRILQSDQALTTKVLQLVNSSFYGFSGKITTLTRAVVILGFSAIKNMAIGFAAFDALKKLKGPVDWDGYWLHGVAVAACGQVAAEKMKYPVPEEVFISGLLHDVGYAIMSAAILKDVSPSELSQVLGDTVAESANFGINHAEAGQMVMEYWRFPEKFCRATRFHHSLNVLGTETDPLLPLIMFADLCAHLFGCGYYEKLPGIRPDELLGRISSAQPDCRVIFREAMLKTHNTLEFFGIKKELGSDPPPPGPEGPPRVLFLSGNAKRIEWINALLENWGYQLASPADLHNPQPCIAAVILDEDSLHSAVLPQLEQKLGEQGLCVALSHRLNADSTELPTGIESLPYNFTAYELKQLINR